MKLLNNRQARKIEELAVNSLAEYIKKAGLKTIVLGISGGRDSAVMAIIGLKVIEKLKREGFELGYHYMFLDVQSKPKDLIKARVLAHELGFVLQEKDLTPWYLACPDRIPNPQTHEEKVFNGNIKCRQRMIILMGKAQITGGIVLDTDDLSEFWMGFWTLMGDVGNVKVMQEITKDEVSDLLEFWHIPAIILEDEPGDGLGVTENNQAREQLGMDYLKIDYVVSRLIQEGFNCNGEKSQLKLNKYLRLFEVIANEIGETANKVYNIAAKTVSSAFKRVNGDGVANLLPDRDEMGLPKLGTNDFNQLYLRAIKKSG